MNESSARVISGQEANQVIQEIQTETGRYCRMFSRGLLRENDLFGKVSDTLIRVIPAFLERNHLRLRIASRDWPAFLDAVIAWRKDGDVRHLRACSWLTFFSSDEERGILFGEEASAFDKGRLLTLFDALHIPVEYYRPVPEGINCPDEYPGHFSSEYFIGDNIWEEDGGLGQGNFTVGETKTLIDHYGLKTVIRIEQHIPESGKSPRCGFDFVGSGTIEGYTSARSREIKVYILKGRVSCLQFFKGNDDMEIRFPLWEDYRKDRLKTHQIHEQIIMDLIKEHNTRSGINP